MAVFALFSPKIKHQIQILWTVMAECKIISPKPYKLRCKLILNEP